MISKKIFKRGAIVLSLMLGTAILISNAPKNNLSEQPSLDDVALLHLAEDVFEDPINNELFDYEIKRIQKGISASSDKKESKKIKSISNKSKFDSKDNEFIANIIGFKNYDELNRYIELKSELANKYKLGELNSDNSSFVNQILTGKLIDKIKEKNSIDFSILFKNTTMSSIPSECMKCAYDFAACVAGSSTITVSESISPAKTTITVWSIHYGFRVGVEFMDNPTPPYGKKITVTMANDPNTCEGMKALCFENCDPLGGGI